ncbi:MAG TPA: hypothetical protein ENK29_03965, partial [Chromatiales bacterium]|nr:hypothetical protein [Chromatiales bacterium]
EGVAAPSHWLAEQGYSRQLVRKYVQGNWLKPLGRGVYARAHGTVTWEGVVLGMQRLAGLRFHLGGVSALNRQGVAHYLPLGDENVIHLWGHDKVPAWVRAIHLPVSLAFHTARLFADEAADVGLVELPAGVRDWILRASGPERAIMEVLSLVDSTEASFTHAAELFAGLTSLRPNVINRLLAACVSIKVKRLFLFLADLHGYPWYGRVERQALDLGSGKRVITKGGVIDRRYQITVPAKFVREDIMEEKRIVIFAGPNGAGKTTVALAYAAEHGLPYLGADQIADEISPGDWDKARVQAGRLFIQRARDHISKGASLVIESTLSGRSLRRLIQTARRTGYRVTLIYVFLETVEHCIARVRERVQKGGHDVPETDIRRRYRRSKDNFWSLYRNEADRWYLLCNSGESPQEVAIGEGPDFEVIDEILYTLFMSDMKDEI